MLSKVALFLACKIKGAASVRAMNPMAVVTSGASAGLIMAAGTVLVVLLFDADVLEGRYYSHEYQ